MENTLRIERFADAASCIPRPEGEARRAEGCKIPAEANLEVRGGHIFQFIPTRGSVLTFFFPDREVSKLPVGTVRLHKLWQRSSLAARK